MKIGILLVCVMSSLILANSNGLVFLGEGVVSETSSNMISLPDAKSAGEFLLGFYEGLGVFSNLPNQEECLSKVCDPAVSNDVVEIVNILKGINKHSDFIEVAKRLTWLGTDIYSKVTEASPICRKWSEEIGVVASAIERTVSSADYFKKVGEHAVLHLGDIETKAKNIEGAFKAGNYRNTGNASGDFIKFSLLWELK
jgi:hypothetical protein